MASHNCPIYVVFSIATNNVFLKSYSLFVFALIKKFTFIITVICSKKLDFLPILNNEKLAGHSLIMKNSRKKSVRSHRKFLRNGRRPREKKSCHASKNKRWLIRAVLTFCLLLLYGSLWRTEGFKQLMFYPRQKPLATTTAHGANMRLRHGRCLCQAHGAPVGPFSEKRVLFRRVEAIATLFTAYPKTVHYPQKGSVFFKPGISTEKPSGGLILQLA